MREQSVLIGNGINIAFSKNDDYKNYAIIQRLSKYLNTDRYGEVFGHIITSSELQIFLTHLNDYFVNMLKGVSTLQLTQNEDELRTLIDIVRRYNGKPKNLIDVGIEDYFFVVKMVFNELGDEATPINSLYLGLKFLFLDAIFNDGKIEKIYTQMGMYQKELSKYSKIFTVNYDTNLDKLTDKPVYHLHGSYDVLDDTYRPETMIGYLAQNKSNPPTITKGKEHLYCNAIMAFSGQRKMDVINNYSNINMALDNLILRIKNPLDKEAKQKYEQLEVSLYNKDKEAYCSIKASLENPNLRNSEYPIAEFRALSGDLHIIGMSPNNDSHIFSIINENPKINRVVYFSNSDTSTVAAQKIIKKPLQIRNISKYWNNFK